MTANLGDDFVEVVLLWLRNRLVGIYGDEILAVVILMVVFGGSVVTYTVRKYQDIYSVCNNFEKRWKFIEEL